MLANKKNALTRLKGNGDFRSEECIELLKEADIVCTNPPFSLFREYIAQLIEYDKKFVVIGGKSSVGCKEIFPLIEENKLWLGYNQKVKKFRVPDYYEGKLITIKENGIKYAENIGNICWFTNLEHKKRFEEMILYRNYSPEAYPKYDNYNAIEVSKVADIPCDYDGVMGVPITFLEKHNPNQFEILGSTQRGCHNKVPDTKKYNDYWEVRQNGEKTGSSGVKTNENPVLVKNDKRKNYFINKEGHIVQSEFTRIFIRRKK